MALKDCPECEHPVSTTAYKCQNCGHQTANGKSLRIVGSLFLFLLGLLIMWGGCNSGPNYDYDYDPVPAATSAVPPARP